jgi:hypothetical protein
MLYLLFGLIVLVILLFITANNQLVKYSKNYENFSISSIGNIRDKIKPVSNNRKISSIIHNNPKDKKKEIEDVQILDDTEKYAYSLSY